MISLNATIEYLKEISEADHADIAIGLYGKDLCLYFKVEKHGMKFENCIKLDVIDISSDISPLETIEARVNMAIKEFIN